MSEKASNAQQKALKVLQNAWRTLLKITFKNYNTAWQYKEKNVKEWEMGQYFYTVLHICTTLTKSTNVQKAYI